MLTLLIATMVLVCATIAAAVITGRVLIERNREAHCLTMAYRKAQQDLSEMAERHSATVVSLLTLERIKAEKERARDQLYEEFKTLRRGEQDRRQVTVKGALKWKRLDHEDAAA